jgi:hypothetical protein
MYILLSQRDVGSRTAVPAAVDKPVLVTVDKAGTEEGIPLTAGVFDKDIIGKMQREVDRTDRQEDKAGK